MSEFLSCNVYTRQGLAVRRVGSPACHISLHIKFCWKGRQERNTDYYTMASLKNHGRNATVWGPESKELCLSIFKTSQNRWNTRKCIKVLIRILKTWMNQKNHRESKMINNFSEKREERHKQSWLHGRLFQILKQDFPRCIRTTRGRGRRFQRHFPMC